MRTRFIINSFFIGLMSLTAGGCAPRPTVSYVKISQPSDVPEQLTDSYYLQTSRLTIDCGKKDSDCSVVSAPEEYPYFKIGVIAEDSQLGMADTVLNIVKIDNTSLVREIGTQVSDNRIAGIKAVGQTITTLAPLAAVFMKMGPQPCIQKPFTAIDLPLNMTTYGITEACQVSESNGVETYHMGYGMTMTLEKLPPDAIPVSSLPSGVTSRFAYAACRDAVLNFNSPGGRRVSKRVKIADPRYLEFIVFPVKGKIVAHSACGFSAVTEAATGVSSGADVAYEIAVQLAAIHNAETLSKK
ncbi:MAG: hypothetical protein PHW76_09350 [Alphaproteobacteria bacterium]|nr:hypothetical protein [Alphaproteobacteria bacterium]